MGKCFCYAAETSRVSSRSKGRRLRNSPHQALVLITLFNFFFFFTSVNNLHSNCQLCNHRCKRGCRATANVVVTTSRSWTWSRTWAGIRGRNTGSKLWYKSNRTYNPTAQEGRRGSEHQHCQRAWKGKINIYSLHIKHIVYVCVYVQYVYSYIHIRWITNVTWM